MLFTETPLKGAYVIDLEKREDERGFFARYYCEQEYAKHGLSTSFVQINNSLAVEKGTLRGMHYQLSPAAETKVVRCLTGALWDCIIDLREDSSTFRQHFAVELTSENRSMLYVPKGFAHGFITLTDNTEALYLVDEFYAPEFERGIRYDDPSFGIEWPLQPTVISEKDGQHPDFNPQHHLAS
jgi:dTDP-4-dehydrorhamnose 3,5-epimerase